MQSLTLATCPELSQHLSLNSDTPLWGPEKKVSVPLSVMLGKVLGFLSGVEEVEVEVRMLVADYWHWNLPVRRWERKEGWLGGSVVGDGDWGEDGNGDGGRRRWRRVERRLVACKTMEEGAKQVMFFRKEEVWGSGGREGDGNGGKGAEVLVTVETAEVS